MSIWSRMKNKTVSTLSGSSPVIATGKWSRMALSLKKSCRLLVYITLLRGIVKHHVYLIIEDYCAARCAAVSTFTIGCTWAPICEPCHQYAPANFLCFPGCLRRHVDLVCSPAGILRMSSRRCCERKGVYFTLKRMSLSPCMFVEVVYHVACTWRGWNRATSGFRLTRATSEKIENLEMAAKFTRSSAWSIRLREIWPVLTHCEYRPILSFTDACEATASVQFGGRMASNVVIANWSICRFQKIYFHR